MLINNKFLTVGLYFIYITVISGQQNLPSGARCTLLDGSLGVCKLITTCKWTENQLRLGLLSYEHLHFLRCGFHQSVEVTCCGDVQIARKSKQACDLYRRYRRPPIPLHIIGGTPAALGEFPHMAALGYSSDLGNETYRFLCGGSLISDRYILTAAHCADRENPIIARLGTLNIINTTNAFDSGEVLDILIESFIQHPNYTSLSKYDDIALIRLATSVPFNQNLHPACLNEGLSDNLQSLELLVTGWGVADIKTFEKSPFLLKTNLTIVTLSSCNKLLKPFFGIKLPSITSGQLCAIDPKGERDACSGDSGGPIQIFDNTSDLRTMPVILGVTSNGIGCGNPIPSIFARVAYYLDWIESIVWLN